MPAAQQKAAGITLPAHATAQEEKQPRMKPLHGRDRHLPAGHLGLYQGNTTSLKILSIFQKKNTTLRPSKNVCLYLKEGPELLLP